MVEKKRRAVKRRVVKKPEPKVIEKPDPVVEEPKKVTKSLKPTQTVAPINVQPGWIKVTEEEVKALEKARKLVGYNPRNQTALVKD